MTTELPEEITNGVLLFEKAFESADHFESVRSFRDAVYLMNDCARDFPLYTNDIADLRFTNAVRLLCRLGACIQNPEYKIWLEYTLLFCIDLKPEIKRLYTEDPSLFETVISFISGYSDEITSELKMNISNFMKEIMS